MPQDRKAAEELNYPAAELARAVHANNTSGSLPWIDEEISGMDRWTLSRVLGILFGTSPYRYLTLLPSGESQNSHSGRVYLLLTQLPLVVLLIKAT